jgi:hypothetical protein
VPPSIAAPVDKPYIGPVKLSVDLSDNTRRIANVHEDIPVAEGTQDLVLLLSGFLETILQPARYLSSVELSQRLTASACSGSVIW